MTLNEVMGTLEALGTEQNRKIYARHGAPPNLFGVSFANLYKVQKKIKVDQALAAELWETRNGDAMMLATLVADPSTITAAQLNAWVKALPGYGFADAVAGLAARTPHAEKLSAKWTASKDEFTSQCGWAVLAHLAQSSTSLSDEYFLERLNTIERTIHSSKNWARRAMNGAVIAIGIRNPKLRKAAVAAAKRIGKVEVDHGETSCKTPDAAAYIAKTVARKQK